MDQFLWPFVALILPLPWLIRRLVTPAHAKSAGNKADALRVSFFYRIATLSHTSQPNSITTVPLFLVLAWVCLVLAGMRPVIFEDEIPIKHDARNIVLAIDFSPSMVREGFTVNGRTISRVNIVKNVVRDFIEKRKGDRIGLVLFGSRAETLAPLSQDTQMLEELFADAGVGIVGEQTAVGDALALSVKNTARTPDGEKIVILLTDGVSNAGEVSIEQGIELAKSQNIRVYTIGIGSKVGGIYYGGDEEALKKIASETGGYHFQAASPNDLTAVYHKINDMEAVTLDGRSVRPRRELFYYPLLLGLVCWILAQRKRRTS